MLQEQFFCSNGCPIMDIAVEQSIQSLTIENEAHTHPIIPGEIKTIIKHLPRRKAPGPDGISNSVLKKLPDKAILYITNIFNFCLRLNYFSKILKSAAIIIYPKPGKNHKLPSSHRPISPLNTTVKMFGTALLTRLKATTMYLIRPEQLGSSTQLQFSSLNSSII